MGKIHFNLEDFERIENEITTTYEVLMREFDSQVSMEEHKYPLTDREKLFVDIIRRILVSLDSSTRSRYR